MSSPPDSPPNGHTGPLKDGISLPPARDEPSDSELSDVNEPLPDEPSPSLPSSPAESSHGVEYRASSPESSVPSDQNASDDEEYNVLRSPASVSSNAQTCRSSSSRAVSSDTSSRRAQKRKFEEDEYMQANPELYGLRRSVWALEILSSLTAELG